jgi:hypothetical protein
MKLTPLCEFSDYAVDLDGNIWSYKKPSGKRPPGSPSPYKMNPWKNNHGYMMISFSKDDKRIHKTAHRLIARTLFGEPSNPNLMVCHKDGDKGNNHPSNLYWGTRKDNYADARRLGEMRQGTAHPKAKLTPDAVREIRTKQKTQKEYAAQFGVHHVTVWNVWHGLNWKSIT